MSATLMRLAALAVTAAALPASAGLVVDIDLIDAQGPARPAGSVWLFDSPEGLRLQPRLIGLPPGAHGFHVHEQPSCGATLKDGQAVPGGAAGPHYDPHGAKHHAGPHGEGHLGDLPLLLADADGSANNPLLAPRLKLADLQGRALIIHAGGDNHADHPLPLGGGGARIACGVVRSDAERAALWQAGATARGVSR